MLSLPLASRRKALPALLALAAAAPACLAQFDPANGQWGKEDPRDIRVMTYNVQDGICSSTTRKSQAGADWDALVRTVAALKPDVIIFQETGDNSGNNTGSGVDSVANLTTTFELFIRGGVDPFRGGNVSFFLQAYDASLDYHIFVSTNSDNFNRNVILSRYPFLDLTGDGESTISDVDFTFPDDWNPTFGNGGIRGHQFAEIDLPDELYAGDLVVGNSHLKAGGSSSDRNQRRQAAQVVAYNNHNLIGGALTGTPDPNNAISDAPPPTDILDVNTPCIWGGDWNDDDGFLNNPSGPQYWFLQGGGGANDGTDRDGSNSSYDQATDFFTGSNGTLGSSKLDYLAYWDSIATQRHAYVFNTLSIPGGNFPPEIAGFAGGAALTTLIAAAHRPVFADYILPEAPEDTCLADLTLDGVCDTAAGGGDGVTLSDFSCYLSLWSGNMNIADITVDGVCDPDAGGGDGVTLSDFSCYLSLWSAGCP